MFQQKQLESKQARQPPLPSAQPLSQHNDDLNVVKGAWRKTVVGDILPYVRPDTEAKNMVYALASDPPQSTLEVSELTWIGMQSNRMVWCY